VVEAKREGSHQNSAAAISSKITGSKSQRCRGRPGCCAPARSRLRGKGKEIRMQPPDTQYCHVTTGGSVTPSCLDLVQKR
jgi:hypothetical protein